MHAAPHRAPRHHPSSPATSRGVAPRHSSPLLLLLLLFPTATSPREPRPAEQPRDGPTAGSGRERERDGRPGGGRRRLREPRRGARQRRLGRWNWRARMLVVVVLVMVVVLLLMVPPSCPSRVMTPSSSTSPPTSTSSTPAAVGTHRLHAPPRAESREPRATTRGAVVLRVVKSGVVVAVTIQVVVVAVRSSSALASVEGPVTASSPPALPRPPAPEQVPARRPSGGTRLPHVMMRHSHAHHRLG
jgi:hypothetical protein